MSETAKKERKASVPVEKFVEAVVSGRAAGKSNKEIAESIGMEVGSFGVRVSQTSRDMRNATAIYKLGNESIKGAALSTKLKVEISKLQNEDVMKQHGYTVETQGRTLPGADAVPRTRTNWESLADTLFGSAE